MAYIVPSVQVYQQLENAGGVLNATPDLDTCIIGPAYNVLSYDGTPASQVASAALSTTTTTGDTVVDSAIITNIAAPGGFSVGQKIIVVGAGADGTNLQAVITSIAGNQFTLDTAAGTALEDAVIAGAGSISNPAITNTFKLPGQKPGQVVTLSSIVPWLNAAKVETVLNGTYGYFDNSLITINIPTGVTGTINGASTTLTITNAAMATQWAVGDVVSIANAGAGGVVPHQATITNISGTTFTVTPAAVTTATTQAVTKVLVANLNATTNTLRAEAGDDVSISYVKVGDSTASTFTSKIRSLTTSSGLNGTLVNFTLNDVLPEGFSTPSTTGTVGAGSSTMTVASANGFATGDTVQISGAGAAGVILETTITVSGLTFTLGVAATTAVTNAKVVKVLRTTAGTINAGSTSITTITGAGSAVFSVGDRIVIKGLGANGADHVATVSAVGATSVTFAGFPTVTTTNVAVYFYKVNNFQLSVRKTYNNQQLPVTRPISGGSNFDTSSTASNGNVAINAGPELVYGLVKSADVYFAYKALRTDLAGTILALEDISDVQGQLGVISDENPLALAVQLALANTIGRIFAIGVASNDLAGHQAALELTETQRLYSLVPLTQDDSILSVYETHVEQQSLPENASWRITLVNTPIPTSVDVGPYSSTFVNSNSGNNNISLVSGNYVLTASNATFLDDGVVAGDIVTVTASTSSQQLGTHVVQSVVSNQQVIIAATGAATAVSYYVSRTLTKAAQADDVADVSTNFGNKRVVHVQPDLCGVEVDGVVKYLPGYYLCAALSGMISGFPVQQGFTNVGVAGISDLKHSNFYFSRADLNTMAAAGTFLFVQATQGGIPYVRHELTTDISVLEYRELLKVKNWDYLSYFFYDKITPFIGSWNITKDTLNTIRQTLIASSELLLSKKLPKIGAPLISYNIAKLEQDAVNKDTINCEMKIEIVSPNNYTNLYLII